MDRGFLLVVSGPSGVGKGTICAEVLKRYSDLRLSISATTRKSRECELDGVNYFFKTREEFEKEIEEDKFLEYANVHGNLYGTPRKFVEEQINEGKIVLLEIDVQGAFQVTENFKDSVLLFILPPSYSELEKRLRLRATDSDESIKLRLKNSADEINKLKAYDYAIINDNLENAVDDFISILRAESLKIKHNNYLDKIF